MLVRKIISATVSGLLMAAFLRVIEGVTAIKVYTLLLNVDYIPLVSAVTGIEWLELSLHMVVAIVLGLLISWKLIPLFESPGKAVVATIVFCLIIGVMLYPSTIFSERTPNIDDVNAWFWWLVAHILYGWILALLLVKSSESGGES